MVTLGCARNEVDSEELAARLEAAGWHLVDDADGADAVLVNTCGFVESAKKDSIDTLLAAADSGGSVVAVGCMAERYGASLAEALPETTVLSFDDYPDIGGRLDDILAGRPLVPHTPADRRTLLPVTPVQRSAAAVAVPGHGSFVDLPDGVAPASGPRVLRRRLAGGPVASLKLASGCDRRCAFCAIPSFRGSFVSRRPDELIAEAEFLADEGVREVVLVSENSTSYGKDLGDLRLLESLLPRLAAVPGIARVRVAYLQPAELRPTLIDVLTSTPGVVPYFDLSFQHSAETVLRRMRRFGSTERFLELLERVRRRVPEAGVRSNFIVGFPGETEQEYGELERFLAEARLDAIGVFGFSPEEGTEAAGLPSQLDPQEVADRAERLSRLAEQLTAQRAEERLGQLVEVLIEDGDGDGAGAEGRAAHQAPEVDGSVTVTAGALPARELVPGAIVRCVVVGSAGVDLRAEAQTVVVGGSLVRAS